MNGLSTKRKSLFLAVEKWIENVGYCPQKIVWKATALSDAKEVFDKTQGFKWPSGKYFF